MDHLFTCRKCGTQNRIGSVPAGQRVLCGNCRAVIAEPIIEPVNRKSGGVSGAVLSWIAIISIALVAWLVNSIETKESSPKKRPSPVASESPRPALKPSRDAAEVKFPRESSQTPPYTRPDVDISSLLPRGNAAGDSNGNASALESPEMPLPPHGEITWYSRGEAIAPLEIRSSRGSNYVVKLCDYYTDRDVLSVFVHGGITARLDVPLGVYKIKYAVGRVWRGPKALFGVDTTYSKADTAFDFRVSGNQVSGYTLTLYEVIDGNLKTSKISPDEF